MTFAVATLIVAIAAAAFGAALMNSVHKSRNRQVQRDYVLLYRGGSWTVHRGQPEPGAISIGGIKYPDVAPVTLPETNDVIHVVAVEPQVLINHEQMDRFRSSILQGEMFKTPNVALQTSLKAIQTGVLVLFLLYLMGSLGSMNQEVARNTETLTTISDTVSEPLPVRFIQEGE
jgi:type II secretory pathway pseudopilin PulG